MASVQRSKSHTQLKPESSRVATALGITFRALRYKLKKLGIE